MLANLLSTNISFISKWEIFSFLLMKSKEKFAKMNCLKWEFFKLSKNKFNLGFLILPFPVIPPTLAPILSNESSKEQIIETDLVCLTKSYSFIPLIRVILLTIWNNFMSYKIM